MQTQLRQSMRATVRKAATTLVPVLLLMVVLGTTSTPAQACSTCMNDNPNRRKAIPILMGFIGVPFVVASGVFYALRRLERDESRTWTSPSRERE